MLSFIHHQQSIGHLTILNKSPNQIPHSFTFKSSVDNSPQTAPFSHYTAMNTNTGRVRPQNKHQKCFNGICATMAIFACIFALSGAAYIITTYHPCTFSKDQAYYCSTPFANCCSYPCGSSNNSCSDLASSIITDSIHYVTYATAGILVLLTLMYACCKIKTRGATPEQEPILRTQHIEHPRAQNNTGRNLHRPVELEMMKHPSYTNNYDSVPRPLQKRAMEIPPTPGAIPANAAPMYLVQGNQVYQLPQQPYAPFFRIYN